MVEVLKPGSLHYTGKLSLVSYTDEKTGKIIQPYLPDDDTINAVNLAIYLGRPLLIKGEPGCGKTRLARSVAYELQLPYEEWHIKSTTKARDGLYTYDSVRRLYDTQMAIARNGTGQPIHFPDHRDYVRLGPLGKAFQSDERTVVLIDEIDKGDIDFPNDLLLELDELRFSIDETGESVVAKHPPIIFITSNDEKDLPNAFLRRCLFQYVEFPTKERLIKIIEAHFNDPPKEVVDAAVDVFLKIRKEIESQRSASKKVSTSELIDWFTVLRRNNEDDNEILAKLKGKIPYLSVLLKNWEDHKRYMREI
jgi:MoxR-like ATPase